MAQDCCGSECGAEHVTSARFRKVLWVALAINALMFLVEAGGSYFADSAALLADAMDFLGDAANYGISLLVLPFGPIWRAKAAWLKGCTMALFGLFVLGNAGWSFLYGGQPHAVAMGSIALLALVANASVAIMLYAFREGDANMRSVWLCSRNDAIGNLAVMLAALGVLGSGSAWPDIFVAVLIGGLGCWSGLQVQQQARSELQTI